MESYIEKLNKRLRATPASLVKPLVEQEKQHIASFLKNPRFNHLIYKYRWATLTLNRYQPFQGLEKPMSRYADSERRHWTRLNIAQEQRAGRLFRDDIQALYKGLHAKSETEAQNYLNGLRRTYLSSLFEACVYEEILVALSDISQNPGDSPELSKERIYQEAWYRFKHHFMEEALMQMELTLLMQRLTTLEVSAERESSHLSTGYTTLMQTVRPEIDAIRKWLSNTNLAHPLLSATEKLQCNFLYNLDSPSIKHHWQLASLNKDNFYLYFAKFLHDNGAWDERRKEDIPGEAMVCDRLIQYARKHCGQGQFQVDIRKRSINLYFFPEGPHKSAKELLIGGLDYVESLKEELLKTPDMLLFPSVPKEAPMTLLSHLATRYLRELEFEDLAYSKRNPENKEIRIEAVKSLIQLFNDESCLTYEVKRNILAYLNVIEENSPSVWEKGFIALIRDAIVSLLTMPFSFFQSKKKENIFTKAHSLLTETQPEAQNSLSTPLHQLYQLAVDYLFKLDGNDGTEVENRIKVQKRICATHLTSLLEEANELTPGIKAQATHLLSKLQRPRLYFLATDLVERLEVKMKTESLMEDMVYANRLNIARKIVTLCDVVALTHQLQAQVKNLLAELKNITPTAHAEFFNACASSDKLDSAMFMHIFSYAYELPSELSDAINDMIEDIDNPPTIEAQEQLSAVAKMSTTLSCFSSHRGQVKTFFSPADRISSPFQQKSTAVLARQENLSMQRYTFMPQKTSTMLEPTASPILVLS